MNKIAFFVLILFTLLFMACDTNNDSDIFWTPHINGRQVSGFTGNAILRGYFHGSIHGNSELFIDAGRIIDGRVIIELPWELNESYFDTSFYDWLLLIIGDGILNPFAETGRISLAAGSIGRCSVGGDFFAPLEFRKDIWVGRNDPDGFVQEEVKWHVFSFIYFSEDTTITASGTSSGMVHGPESTYTEININVKKGWNIIYDYFSYDIAVDPNNARRLITSDRRNAHSDMRWEIISGN